MYICVCNAIRECDFRNAARRSGSDAESIYAQLGKRPNCRHCLEDAEAIVQEEREAARPMVLAA